MAQHPANGMHGGFLIHDAGITGGIHVGSEVYHGVRACRLIAAT